MKIVIVDDDRFVCESLRTILQADEEITVAAVAGSGEEAMALYETLHPDVLLMDIQMQGIGGLKAGEEILREHPEAKILFLTTFLDDAYIIEALRIGAAGYLIKQKIEIIAPALKAVMAGQSVFGNEIVDKLPGLMHTKPQASLEDYGLAPREMEVVELAAQGMNNREIAQKLCLSEGTVRNYISTVLDKLYLRDRTQLVVFYYQKMKA
ncbi:MAG: response regulator transcription factor [Blautia sp.]